MTSDEAPDLYIPSLEDALGSSYPHGTPLAMAGQQRRNVMSVGTLFASLLDTPLELTMLDFDTAYASHVQWLSQGATDATSGIGIGRFKMRDVKEKRRVFSGLNLRLADLSDCDLSYADFSRCGLIGATFKRSNLLAASFDDAECYNADFSDTDLKKTHFHHAKCANANFSRADMEGMRASSADFRYACFDSTSLRSTTLLDSSLQSATLNDADLHDAILLDSNMSGRAPLFCDMRRRFILYVLPETRGGPRFIAGCRNFDAAEALNHWKPENHREPDIAAKYREAIVDWLITHHPAARPS